MGSSRKKPRSRKVINFGAPRLSAPVVSPKSCKGRRNLYCVAYDACLDTAIQNNWHTFSCPANCAYIHSYDPPDIVTNGPDHWELYDFYLW